jgi:hypothetical protein
MAVALSLACCGTRDLGEAGREIDSSVSPRQPGANDAEDVGLAVVGFIETHQDDWRFGAIWTEPTSSGQVAVHVRYLDDSFAEEVLRLSEALTEEAEEYRGGASFQEMKMLQDEAHARGIPFGVNNESGLLAVYADDAVSLGAVLDASPHVIRSDPATLPLDKGE